MASVPIGNKIMERFQKLNWQGYVVTVSKNEAQGLVQSKG